MAELTKRGWPKTADGVTDWEQVFEDPEHGFVALVDKAETVDVLKQCATVVIQQLFTRKGDEVERDRATNLLERVTDSDAIAAELGAKKRLVSSLLRNIKGERLEKAEEYLRRKKKRAIIERRGMEKRRKKQMEYGMWGVGAVILSIALYFMVMWIVDAVWNELRAPKGPTVIQGTLEGVDTGYKPKEKESKADKKEKNAESVWQVIFNPVKWTFSPGGKKSRIIYYSPVLTLEDPSSFPGICKYMPSLLDAIYTSMSASLPVDRMPTPEDLTQIGAHATVKINLSLGAQALTAVTLRTDVNSRDVMSTRAPCRPFREPATE